MTKDLGIDARAIIIQGLVEQLAPGTRLTLVFNSAQGTERRRHRIVISADTNVVRLATVPPESEPYVEIEFWPGDRVVVLSDGFMLLPFQGDTTGSRYVWGHV
jgi:hypothetical protein